MTPEQAAALRDLVSLIEPPPDPLPVGDLDVLEDRTGHHVSRRLPGAAAGLRQRMVLQRLARIRGEYGSGLASPCRSRIVQSAWRKRARAARASAAQNPSRTERSGKPLRAIAAPGCRVADSQTASIKAGASPRCRTSSGAYCPTNHELLGEPGPLRADSYFVALRKIRPGMYMATKLLSTVPDPAAAAGLPLRSIDSKTLSPRACSSPDAIT